MKNLKVLIHYDELPPCRVWEFEGTRADLFKTAALPIDEWWKQGHSDNIRELTSEEDEGIFEPSRLPITEYEMFGEDGRPTEEYYEYRKRSAAYVAANFDAELYYDVLWSEDKIPRTHLWGPGFDYWFPPREDLTL